MNGPGNSDDQFEKNWREAIEDISQEPPSSLWREIDRQLVYEELASVKSKTVYYKWAVAVVIMLASFLGISQYLYFASQRQEHILSGIVEVDEPKYEAYNISIPEKEETGSSFMGRKFNSAYDSIQDQDKEYTPSTLENFQTIEVESLEPSFEMASANVKNKYIYMMPTYTFKSRRSSRASSEDKYWAGLNVGSGSFDPNYRSGANTLTTSNAASAFSLVSNDAVENQGPSLRESMTTGVSVALGINFGMKLNSKWSIESGVQYARAGVTTTTNIVIESSKVQEVIPASAEIRSIPQVESIIDSEDVLEYDYKDVDLANQFQFATVPVKAGYMVVDQKFRLQLNAGFAANLYLGNKLTDPDHEIGDVTIGPGDSSPYREVSFSGLAGIQLGYKFLNRFDLVLEPNYRQSINSLTKESSSFTANPSEFGIMTGIRYNFN